MSTEKRGKRPLSPVRQEQNRREFIRTTILAGGTMIAALAGYFPLASGGVQRLRPPGALKDARLDEHDFLSACIKCGQCVQVCP
ncbi:MAG: 4Fe-4S binding protein, partial [Sedimenticolaceae bacterium]